MKEKIDWQALATQVGTLKKDGDAVSRRDVCNALEILLGKENIRAAVEYYISGKPGSELARFVLWRIHPLSAMEHCYDIYKSDEHIENRRLAVELLRVVADERAINWIDEFLEDADAEIQEWGIGILDQLLRSELVKPEDVENMLRKAEAHTNFQVRERVESIKGFLSDTFGADETMSEDEYIKKTSNRP